MGIAWPFGLESRRRAALSRAGANPLRDYLSVALPRPGTDYREVEYLAVDLETTGLNPNDDLIISVGYVVARGDRIDLGTAAHHLVRIDRAIPESSAVIHQITDDQASEGAPFEQVLALLLDALAGRVMIAHHASVERRFIEAGCKRIFGTAPPMRVIDTQRIAQRTFELRQIAYKASDLRLHALCERHHLPRTRAHNAFCDALAAAQLFLAQAALRDDGRGVALRDFL